MQNNILPKQNLVLCLDIKITKAKESLFTTRSSDSVCVLLAFVTGCQGTEENQRSVPVSFRTSSQFDHFSVMCNLPSSLQEGLYDKLGSLTLA